MAFCQQCGKPLSTGNLFCESCGAKNEPGASPIRVPERPISMSQAPPPPPPPPPPTAVFVPQSTIARPTPTPPPVTRPVTPPPISTPQSLPLEPRAQGSGNSLFIGIAALLGVLAIALGVFAFMQTGKLNDSRVTVANLQQDVSNLQTNVTTLESQLATEKTNVSNLNNQLSDEKARSTSIQTELTNTKATLATTQGNLTTAQSQITSLQTDLNTSKARATSLETDLATANGRVTSIQADLTKTTADLAKANSDLVKANSDLTAAKATNTTLTNDLNKVKAPRHFATLQELTDWLAKDDTNTSSKYASYNLMQKYYVLQVKAARDGFIISVISDTDGSSIYVGAEAIVGTTVYLISVTTDTTTSYITGIPAMPSTPLPLE